MAGGYFTVKNINPLIRTLDLRDAQVKVLLDRDEDMISDYPLTADLTVLYNLYDIDPDAVFNMFFYYIEVDSEGIVKSLEQIYTP